MYSGLEHKLRKGLHSKRFVKDLILLDSTDSTNNHGLSLKEKKEGMVILARKQIGGRGRDGRLWHSVEDKSIAMSIIIDYPKSNDSITFVPLLSANAIVDTLDFFGLNSKIKWPNDVLINSKKVSGVLCESSFIKNYSNFIIVGIGINVNLNSEDFIKDGIDYVIKPTSLKMETSKNFSLEDIATTLLNNFSKWIFEYKTNNYDNILKFWKNNWFDEGKQVSVIKNGKLITGTAKDINLQGHLVLQMEDGLEVINSGELKI
ncbi:MAG TPA: biotin--[acetyl-CoA-carboxylase] ligase [Candidatus Dadabacteria bacterium]|nr:biotin--[acetyl-CoA-carboxylase] ligase [Candidatus Dadabacteria bacterium]